MTAAEQSQLDSMRGEFNARFDKLETLLESRRLESSRELDHAQNQIEDRRVALEDRLRRVEFHAHTSSVFGSFALVVSAGLLYHIVKF